MAEQQASLGLDVKFEAAPVVTAGIREEIAAKWGLPLGQQVEVSLRGQSCALRGTLQLRSAPDYPWDGRQALQLAVAGFEFSTRELESWTVL